MQCLSDILPEKQLYPDTIPLLVFFKNTLSYSNHSPTVPKEATKRRVASCRPALVRRVLSMSFDLSQLDKLAKGEIGESQESKSRRFSTPRPVSFDSFA